VYSSSANRPVSEIEIGVAAGDQLTVASPNSL
jgi:hypothetical protein